MSFKRLMRAAAQPGFFFRKYPLARMTGRDLVCSPPRRTGLGEPLVEAITIPWRLAGAAAASLLWLSSASPSRTEDRTEIAEHWLQRLGSEAKLLDTSLHEKLLENRVDKQFIWQTCTSDRGIQYSKIFVCSHSGSTSGDVIVGKTRVCAVLRLGDTLNGHVGLIHGGFAAAILDDMTGLASWLEKEARELGRDAKIFTANLNVNYRRPMPCNSEYFVDIHVDRVEKSKKIYLIATIHNERGDACVEATALYIVKQ